MVVQKKGNTMKHILLLILILPLFCFAQQDMKVYKGKKRFYIYSNDSAYGSFKIRHPREYKKWEALASYGIGLSGAPQPSHSSTKRMGANGIANAGISLFVSKMISIGLDYSQTSLSYLYSSGNKDYNYIIADCIRYAGLHSMIDFRLGKFILGGGLYASYFVSNQSKPFSPFNKAYPIKGYSFGVPIIAQYPIIKNLYGTMTVKYNYDWITSQDMHGWRDSNYKLSRYSGMIGVAYKF